MKNKILNLIILIIIGIFLFGISSPAKSAISSSWQYQMIAFYAHPSSASGTLPVYRFFNLKKGGYYYTISKSTRDSLISKKSETWKYQGTAFYAYAKSKSGTLPVYQFFNLQKGGYYYTISKSTRDSLISNKSEIWKYQGTAFYAYSKNTSVTLPVYRYYNSGNDSYYYMMSKGLALLGPEITVGVWSFSTSDLESEAFRIDANKNYVIKNNNGKIIGTINKDEITKVKYDGSGKLRVYETINSTLSDEIVYFEAADGNNSDMIFDVHLPGYSYDQYRGKIRLDYSKYTDPNTDEEVKRIWVINALPLEHYVWGDGELAGTGDADHNRVMVTSFRTYGYWWIEYATKWARAGFKVNATPGNQIYRGYDYEKNHSSVKQAAVDTRGYVVMHKGETAITPYSSWTDGKTRSFEERWGSDDYPWCDSVDDPYGDYNGDYWDNSHKSTATLEDEGNHMVGLSAHGSVTLANDKGWSWTRILNYYFKDVDVKRVY